MKYSIIKVINGNYFVHAEGITDIAAAKVLWNAPDVITAYVMIADEQLDAVEGYKEFIHHEVQPEAEPEQE